MSTNPLVRKLLNVARLGPEEQSRLEGLAHDVRTTKRKRNIIKEGQRPDFVHLVLDGWAARYKILPDGSRQILAFLLPGDFCDLHVPILREMDHGIVALTECSVAYVTTEAIDELTEREHRIARAMWWATLVDEAVLRSWIVNLGRRGAQERIAHLFCELHARLKMIDLVQGDMFTLPLTQEEIGDATGLTSVHTNRTLQLLRAKEIIDLSQQNLTILRPEKMRELAGFNPNYLHLQPRLADQAVDPRADLWTRDIPMIMQRGRRRLLAARWQDPACLGWHGDLGTDRNMWTGAQWRKKRRSRSPATSNLPLRGDAIVSSPHVLCRSAA